jgi:hypothetical protein
MPSFSHFSLDAHAAAGGGVGTSSLCSRNSCRQQRIDTFRQMMYVSGETAEPSVETTSIIEDIVRQQVIELVCNLDSVISRYGIVGDERY